MRKRIFIVCGGRSLKDVPLGWLRKEDTIAVNYMGKHLPEPTYFLTADSGVIAKAVESNGWTMPIETHKVVVINPKEHPRWEQVKKYVASPVYPFYDDWVVPTRWDGDISLDSPDFATGKNTGFCALQYAVQLGYKEIYLMGVDLQKTEGKKYCYDGPNVIARSDSPYRMFFRHFEVGLKRLADAGIKVYSCSPISPLNTVIPFVEWKSLVPKIPVFVSHYTLDTAYQYIVVDLINSLQKWGLDYHISGITTLGSWRANSNWCATQVRQMLDRFEPRPILRLDADAVVQKYPKFLETKAFGKDFSAVIWKQSKLRPRGELMGGTLYFGNTAKARLLVDDWLIRLGKRPNARNPDMLQVSLSQVKPKFIEMPISYCRIFDFPNMGPDKVIEHFQASRKCKKAVNQHGAKVLAEASRR